MSLIVNNISLMFNKVRQRIEGGGWLFFLLSCIKYISGKLLNGYYPFILGLDSASIPISSKISNPKFIKIGRCFYASGPVWIDAINRYRKQSFNPMIVIGNNVSASQNLHISCIRDIYISDGVLFGSNVHISDNSHGKYCSDHQSDPCIAPAERDLYFRGKVYIGSNCWVGNNVVILGPVNIGSGVIIAANSVVNKSIPNNVMVAGAPAKIIKIFSNEKWIMANE